MKPVNDISRFRLISGIGVGILACVARADEPNLTVVPLKPSYKISDSIRLTVKNKGKKDQKFLLCLDVWERTFFNGCMEDAFAASSKDKPHVFLVRAGGSVAISWHPLGQKAVYVPKVGSRYRFLLMPEEALQGGGAVFHSTAFKIVKARATGGRPCKKPQGPAGESSCPETSSQGTGVGPSLGPPTQRATMEDWIELEILGVHAFTQLIDGPANRERIDELRSVAGGWLPDDYIQLMLAMDGFDGVIGDDFERGGYFVLPSCEAMMRGADYNLAEYEPSMFLLGNDGGGMAYLIDREAKEWVEMPFECFGEQGEDRVERRFPDLATMLKALADRPV